MTSSGKESTAQNITKTNMHEEQGDWLFPKKVATCQHQLNTKVTSATERKREQTENMKINNSRTALEQSVKKLLEGLNQFCGEGKLSHRD